MLTQSTTFGDPRLPAWLWRRIAVVDGCWIWATGLSAAGYGRIRWDGELVYAHRLMYESLIGPIPEGLEIDHLCRNRACVDPAHLEPVTHRVNLLRGDVGAFNAAKTHCPQGHPYDEANTGRSGTHRYCRRCSNDRRALTRLRTGR